MARLYKLYKEEFCPERNINPVSLYVYEKIFKSYDPPLAFYKPKKDQCAKCNVYKCAEDKTSLQRDYDEHKAREKESLEMKAYDKNESIEGDGTKRVITFHLQAILSVPHTAVSKILYLQKFFTYNFTILDNYQNTGLCYMWDENNGKKAALNWFNFIYLTDLPENVKTVTSFSDTCSGQNRNKYVTLAALYAVINVPRLKTVNLKYLEYLEADCIHASIERARKHKKYLLQETL
ncbi:unnamed protein product [Parnassius apollo]|uniref:(apollo) hypothetical protein n=1 Tax=Parnassius apollo TaxID=110799 RepID=A0A8S3WL66_PARAO|nr:unnamed protein product [Parnassius apollo]